jgi:hypothetical protein
MARERPDPHIPTARVPNALPCPKCQTLTAKAIHMHDVWPQVQYYRCEACAHLWAIQIERTDER